LWSGRKGAVGLGGRPDGCELKVLRQQTATALQDRALELAIDTVIDIFANFSWLNRFKEKLMQQQRKRFSAT
jgi:hypothetical protein